MANGWSPERQATEADLFQSYRTLFGSQVQPADGGATRVIDLIFREADACLACW